MQEVKVNAILNIVSRKGYEPRYNLTVILENQVEAEQSFSKNFNNLELTPTKPLVLGDVQYLLNKKGKGSLINTKKSFRFNNVKAEVGIGRYKETDDKYYFVRVYLLDDLTRTCYLSQSQIKNLEFMDLGFEFKEDPDFVPEDDTVDFDDKKKSK